MRALRTSTHVMRGILCVSSVEEPKRGVFSLDRRNVNVWRHNTTILEELIPASHKDAHYSIYRDIYYVNFLILGSPDHICDSL